MIKLKDLKCEVAKYKGTYYVALGVNGIWAVVEQTKTEARARSVQFEIRRGTYNRDRILEAYNYVLHRAETKAEIDTSSGEILALFAGNKNSFYTVGDICKVLDAKKTKVSSTIKSLLISDKICRSYLNGTPIYGDSSTLPRHSDFKAAILKVLVENPNGLSATEIFEKLRVNIPDKSHNMLRQLVVDGKVKTVNVRNHLVAKPRYRYYDNNS